MASVQSGILAAGIVLLGFAASHTAAAPPHHAKHRAGGHKAAVPVKDSFLHAQVSTVAELVREVKSDKAARDRYGRYYNIPSEAIPRYFQDNFVAGKLSKASDYTISLVRPTGVVYPVRLSLAQGTWVFTNHGNPVLLRASGNPISPYGTPIEIHYVTKRIPVNVPGPDKSTVQATQQEGTPVPVIVNTPVYTPSKQTPSTPVK